MDFSTIEEMVEEVIRLDNDDAAYLEKITTPFWPYGDRFIDYYNCEKEKELAFFRNIFDQPLSKAYRRTEYGYIQEYLKKMKAHYHTSELVTKEKKRGSLKSFVKKIIRR